MPEPDELTTGALRRLDKRLGAFETNPRAKSSVMEIGAAGGGYRLLGQMLGGVLGGLGLGWATDQVAHTGPWGVIVGLVVGSVLSVYATVRTASRMSAAAAKSASVAAHADVEDEQAG